MRYALLALAALPLPAMAETFTVPSAPTAVTVYGGFAMVTREVTLEVSAGAHELVLPDLPQWIDAGSLRVSLEGAQLRGTRLRTDALPPQPDSDSAAVAQAKTRIETAERALRDLDDRVEEARLAEQAAEARLAFLAGLSGSETLPTAPDALAEVGQMIEAQTLLATRVALEARRTARDVAEARPDLEEDLRDARAALEALTPPAEPMALLALALQAPGAGNIIATVSYPTGASWQPTYDVALTTGDTPRLSLRRAALISQYSGENWENVSLTLSTLAPTGQVMPSDIYPPLLRFGDPEERGKMELSRSSLSADAVGAPPVMMEAALQPDFDGPGVSYTLPGPVTVARDAEGVRLEFDALQYDARVFARAVPARDATAFLMAEAVNASAEPLLAAQTAQIFVDGTLVGRSNFAAVPAGGEITQAFGPIEDLRLTHVVLDRSEGDRGLISRSNAQTQEVRMTVENLGSRTWDVELLEAVPYSEQDDLVIDWSANPPAYARNVLDRRGLMQWNLTLSADDRQEITLEQTVRWPEGKVLQ